MLIELSIAQEGGTDHALPKELGKPDGRVSAVRRSFQGAGPVYSDELPGLTTRRRLRANWVHYGWIVPQRHRLAKYLVAAVVLYLIATSAFM